MADDGRDRPRAPSRRRWTSELLVALRELSVPMSGAIDRSVGEALSSNAAVLVLTHLAERGELRSGELGRLAHLTRGGMSNMLRRFEERGLVERVPGTDDGRAVVVSLTPAGRRAEQQLREAVFSALDQSQAVVKEAIVLLVALGASSTGRWGGTASEPGRLVTMALAEAGATIGDVLATTGSATASMTLAALDGEGPCRVGRVASMLGITSGGATRLIDQLESDELVTRMHGDPVDGRSVTVALTSRGERHLDGLAADLAPQLGVVLDAMRVASIELGGTS